MLKNIVVFLTIVLAVGCYKKVDDRFMFVVQQGTQQCLACSLVGIISEYEQVNYEEYIDKIDEMGREVDRGNGHGELVGITVNGMQEAIDHYFNKKYKIKETYSFNKIKKYVQGGTPVMGIFYTTDEWSYTWSGEITENYTINPKKIHSVIVYKIDEEWVYFLNSWGIWWGTGGGGKMKIELVRKYFIMGLIIEKREGIPPLF